MDFKTTAEQEIINELKNLLVSPNLRQHNFSSENDKLYSKFIADVDANKKVSVQLPLDYVLKYELFNLIKEHKIFIESSVKFIATFTTTKPTNVSKIIYDTKYIGNEFNYSFLDNHPGILNVDKLKDIPVDYEGLMAVPPTVLEYKNIQNFNIHRVLQTPRFNGKNIYSRIVISNKFAIV